jgi:hypothetical protein
VVFVSIYLVGKRARDMDNQIYTSQSIIESTFDEKFWDDNNFQLIEKRFDGFCCSDSGDLILFSNDTANIVPCIKGEDKSSEANVASYPCNL